jgi:two-component system response regulator HydG
MKNSQTILIAEDDESHRLMLSVILASWGYSTYEAKNGPYALALVHRRNVDLVLMDIKNAQVSGIEVLRKLRSFEPCLPVILMTAYCPPELIAEAMSMGASDILVKPIRLDQLEEVIHRALVQRQFHQPRQEDRAEA